MPCRFCTLSRNTTCDPHVASLPSELIAVGAAISAINHLERSIDESDMHCEIVCSCSATETKKTMCSGTNGAAKIGPRYVSSLPCFISGAFVAKAFNAKVTTKPTLQTLCYEIILTNENKQFKLYNPAEKLHVHVLKHRCYQIIIPFI